MPRRETTPGLWKCFGPGLVTGERQEGHRAHLKSRGHCPAPGRAVRNSYPVFPVRENTTKLRRAVDKASCCLAGQCLFPSGGDKGIKGTGNSLNVRPPIFHRRDNIPMSKQIKKQFKRGKFSGLLQPTHRKPVLQALYNIQNRPTILRITFPSSIANIHDNKSVINSGTK